MKSHILLLLFVFAWIYSGAQNQIHWVFAQGSAVTYAITPDTIKDLNHKYKLTRKGKPLFFAIAPQDKDGGSILLDGLSGYVSNYVLHDQASNYSIEIWVKPQKIDNKGKHIVFCNGSITNGYRIEQQGDHWIVAVGNKYFKSLGKVVLNQWTHLAVVVSQGKLSGYNNASKVFSGISIPKSFDSQLMIGCNSLGRDGFIGDIYEFRWKKYIGAFNVNKNLLINVKEVEKQNQSELKERKSILDNLSHNDQIQWGTEEKYKTQERDWLIHKIEEPSVLKGFVEKDGTKLILTNGLIERQFYVSDNVATTSLKNLHNNAEFIRAIKPESKLKINDEWYDIGGLTGQPEKAYLMEEWLPNLKANPNAFKFSDLEVSAPHKRYVWNKKYNAQPAVWPPKGIRVTFHYKAPKHIDKLRNISVDVDYEMYDGVPVVAKWITLINGSDSTVVVNRSKNELLAIAQDQTKRIHVESDYSNALINADPKGSALLHYAGTVSKYHAGETSTHWYVDKDYNTWATQNQAEDKLMEFPHRNLLVSECPIGPNASIEAQSDYHSFITFELLNDSDDKERQSLGMRRMYRILAPQVTETLLGAAITSHDKKQLESFIDQMYELGFERLDIHPWPGVEHSNLDSDYVKFWHDIASYAKAHNIIMGAYELQIASRGRGKEYDCVDPKTGKNGSLFGQSVCIASKWRDDYFSKMWEFMSKTGFKSYNMDGPYHGDVCASPNHPYHVGLNDSRWRQWQIQVDVLHELQNRNFFIPIPDWYFLNGSTTTSMGYREASANLSPQQQLLLGRQYIYDGTWFKLPTMGSMTLQLVGFYTNDPKVGLEPLSENIERYERGLFQYLASGCAFSVRGNRLYDTPETKSMVEKWIHWYKKYRVILSSEIVHMGRPTGRGLDYILHANPFNKEKGMLIVFNPTNKEISKTIKIPVYYMGLKDSVKIREGESQSQSFDVSRDSFTEYNVTIPANGYKWYVIE